MQMAVTFWGALGGGTSLGGKREGSYVESKLGKGVKACSHRQGSENTCTAALVSELAVNKWRFRDEAR